MSELSHLDDEDIQKVVKAVLKDCFPNVRILRVNIHNIASDDDGDEIAVKIIFEAAKGAVDPKQIPAFFSAVVDKLNEAEESRFPIISFIAKSDLGNRKLETV